MTYRPNRAIERPRAQQFALHCEAVHLRAVLALAAREMAGGSPPAGGERLAAIEAQLAERFGVEGPMARLAERLHLDPVQVSFLWAAAALAADPRVPVSCEALSGGHGRNGLDVVTFTALHHLDSVGAHDLIAWLNAAGNPLITRGLLTVVDELQVPPARPFAVPMRLVAHLRGDDQVSPPLTLLGILRPAPLFDEAQRTVLTQLDKILRAPSDVVVVIEGPIGSGRRTATTHVAAGRPLVALDAAKVERRRMASALLALRCEAFLADALPIIADVDAWHGRESPGAGHDDELARIIDGWDVPVVVTTSVPGLEVATHRPTVRVRWPVAIAPLRRQFWAARAVTRGEPAVGDLDALAHRYRAGPGGIARAVATARTLLEPGERLSASHLALGVRYNIAERLAGLARRLEVTQGWDDLVIAEDMLSQLHALVARIRHAPKVFERWGYQRKIPRGTGVAALFSGPPGTGKTMCAGLIARELDLELYAVDLSQVVSKWVGETEKQLSRVFDAAEEGHALLLFDEADSLFRQRSSETRGAVDRYANLEVNYLLQRIESFGGITVLTTNLESAIDPALRRRLAAHIVFDAPDEDERATLWERLLRTGTAPVAGDVNAHELACTYQKMTGANIRNAVLGAAFAAAAAGVDSITQADLHRAARVEYRAMGYVLAERPWRGRSTPRS